MEEVWSAVITPECLLAAGWKVRQTQMSATPISCRAVKERRTSGTFAFLQQMLCTSVRPSLSVRHHSWAEFIPLLTNIYRQTFHHLICLSCSFSHTKYRAKLLQVIPNVEALQLYGYTSKCSVPYRPDLPFLISDIRALRRSGLSARVPECQKLKMAGWACMAKCNNLGVGHFRTTTVYLSETTQDTHIVTIHVWSVAWFDYTEWLIMVISSESSSRPANESQ